MESSGNKRKITDRKSSISGKVEKLRTLPFPVNEIFQSFAQLDIGINFISNINLSLLSFSGKNQLNKH